MTPDAKERRLELMVSNADRALDAARLRHRDALTALRKYRRAKAKAQEKDFPRAAMERT